MCLLACQSYRRSCNLSCIHRIYPYNERNGTSIFATTFKQFSTLVRSACGDPCLCAYGFILHRPGCSAKRMRSVTPSVIALTSVRFTSATANFLCARAVRANSMPRRSHCSSSPSSAEKKRHARLETRRAACSFSLPLALTARIPICICSSKPPAARSTISPIFIFQTIPCACSQAAAWALRWHRSCSRLQPNRVAEIRSGPRARLEKTGHPHRHHRSSSICSSSPIIHISPLSHRHPQRAWRAVPADHCLQHGVDVDHAAGKCVQLTCARCGCPSSPGRRSPS